MRKNGYKKKKLVDLDSKEGCRMREAGDGACDRVFEESVYKRTDI